MPTTSDGRDGDSGTPAPGNVALADEESLHRVFLSEYSALTAEARADLGDDAPALVPKVVEGSFVRAWDARARFRTPEEVHQFLVDDVHHAAARALSRRAGARRLAGHEHADAHSAAATTPEESWKHIQHALHGESHSPEALARAAAVSRHDAAEHIVRATKTAPPWMAIGLGALLVVVLIGLARWMTHASSDQRFAAALNAPDVRLVASRSAQIGVVTLDDGSTVRLAPESKLTIPRGFGPDLRVVRLEGTAAFQVAQGMANALHVFANNAAVVATGTAFTVRSVLGDSAVVVVVTEGSVRAGPLGELQDVATGSALVIDGETTRAATTPEREEADAWREGTLAVSDRSLKDVLAMMSRWYGQTIAAQPDSLLNRRVTFRASLDSTRQAIRGIEQSTGLEFGWVGPNMVFQLPTAKAAPAAKKTAR